MNILHLTLKKQWFDLIKSGEKKEEYREIKRYWIDRLVEEFGFSHDEDGFNSVCKAKPFDIIRFKNGYAKDAPAFDIEFKGIEVKEGRKEWGAVPGEKYFVLQLGNILNLKN